MKLGDCLKAKAGLVLSNIVIACCFFSFLYFTGTGSNELTLLLLCWFSIVAIYISVDCIGQKKKMDKLHNIVSLLDKKYLLA